MECRTMHQHSPFLVMCLAQFLGAVLLSRRKINTFKLTDGPKQCILGENSNSVFWGKTQTVYFGGKLNVIA